MSEALKQISADLASVATDYIVEKGPEYPQLVTAHIGDDLTLTIMIVASLPSMGISERLGEALSEVAEIIMSEATIRDAS